MNSTHSTGAPANWRVISNSEVKSDSNGGTQSQTGRAYSAAVKIFKQKGGGVIIPKQSLKKKTQAGLVNLKNQGGPNFRTIQGKSSGQNSQSTSKSQVVTAATIENFRRTQLHANSMTTNASMLVSSAGAQEAYKSAVTEGRNKSPSLAKSMNENPIVQHATTEVGRGRLNNFQLPQSEMSRQRDTLNPMISSTSSRRGGDEANEGQRSFRIRKYSRSLSRSSRTSLHSARDGSNGESPDMQQLKTIEIDNIKPNVDIKLHSQNNHHQQFKSAGLPSSSTKQEQRPRRIKPSKYKQERDALATLLGDIQARFALFKKAHDENMAESDTGGRKLSTSAKLEDEKDKRIRALEEEVARLRQRERALLDKLKAVG